MLYLAKRVLRPSKLGKREGFDRFVENVDREKSEGVVAFVGPDSRRSNEIIYVGKCFRFGGVQGVYDGLVQFRYTGTIRVA